MAEMTDQQRRYREFLELMPLTLALAGLPPSEHGKYYNEEQIETRIFAIRHAHKAARQLVRELVQK
jgi:hypothetical protein